MPFKKGNVPPMKGKHHTKEAKKRLSECQKKMYLKGNRLPKSVFMIGCTPWNKGMKTGEPSWNKGLKMSKEHCEKISILLKGKPAWNKGLKGFGKGHVGYMLGKRHSEQTKKKMSVSQTGKKKSSETIQKMSGKNCHRWKGGITPERYKIRNSLEIKVWKSRCFGRDDWTCQKCKQKGGELNVHHINNFSSYLLMRSVIYNGITLCKSCHKKFHNIYGRKDNTQEQLDQFLYSKHI